MRLTLRTLLAYLDDVLEPADTKVIGQKIQESPMAQLLVSRVREVMRQRRLKAPEVHGPEMGIDPNIIAKYLDNTLQPEQYADIERVLLASNELLAEAAACHQVLTIDLPAVALATRERLYALGPVDTESQLSVLEESPVSPIKQEDTLVSAKPDFAVEVSAVEVDVASAPVKPTDWQASRTPDVVPRSFWSRRGVQTGIVALLLLVSGALVIPELGTRIQQANLEMQRKDSGDPTLDGELVNRAKALEDPQTPSLENASIDFDQPQTPAGFPAVADRAEMLRGLDPAPPTDEMDEGIVPAPAAPDTAKPLQQTGGRDATTLAAGRVNGSSQESTPKLGRQTPEESGQSAPHPDQLVPYVSVEGVLLRFDSQEQHWFKVPHQSSVSSDELIANIEPFESRLDFESERIQLTMIGETVLTILAPRPAETGGIRVQRGRILIQGSQQDPNQTGIIAIGIGDDLWKLELQTPETVCALEVISRESTHFQESFHENWYQATLGVLAGSARWIRSSGESQEIGERLMLAIAPENPSPEIPRPEHQMPSRRDAVSFVSAPDWTDVTRRKTAAVRRYPAQAPFEKMFDLNQPAEILMRNLVKNNKFSKITELATQSLAAMDDCHGLVEVLAESPHEEARFAAREGLRRWLPLQPHRAMVLKEVLQSRYADAEADSVYRMLWGFSREDVTNSKTNSWLFINWMRSPRSEIRELADYWVERLLEKKTEYRALGGTAAQREQQVRRLEEQIERNNGLIKAP